MSRLSNALAIFIGGLLSPAYSTPQQQEQIQTQAQESRIFEEFVDEMAFNVEDMHVEEENGRNYFVFTAPQALVGEIPTEVRLYATSIDSFKKIEIEGGISQKISHPFSTSYSFSMLDFIKEKAFHIDYYRDGTVQGYYSSDDLLDLVYKIFDGIEKDSLAKPGFLKKEPIAKEKAEEIMQKILEYYRQGKKEGKKATDENDLMNQSIG